MVGGEWNVGGSAGPSATLPSTRPTSPRPDCPPPLTRRQGADVLSKWVGEAERQLRLLFEEATRCQPSIIFFDEIDGLAPVSDCGRTDPRPPPPPCTHTHARAGASPTNPHPPNTPTHTHTPHPLPLITICSCAPPSRIRSTPPSSPPTPTPHTPPPPLPLITTCRCAPPSRIRSTPPSSPPCSPSWMAWTAGVKWWS